jgi:hypothetical protein
MGKQRSGYQERIIRNYYRNQDAIMLQRLSEMVADLFLAEGKKRATLWTRVSAALTKLKVPDSQIEHIVASNNPTLLANLLQELLGK